MDDEFLKVLLDKLRQQQNELFGGEYRKAFDTTKEMIQMVQMRLIK